MIYRTDYHIHTLFSDGKGDPEDYLAPALKEGLSEIGFADHLTLTDQQQDWSIDPSRLNEYCDSVLKLKDRSKNIKIRLGLEVDFLPGKEELILKSIRDLPLDYLIGSVHYLDNISVDTGPEYYENRDIYRLFDKYFEAVEKAAATGLFNIIAHPDLVRIYGHLPAEDPEPLYRRLAASLKRSDVAIEINTNGMNKPLSSFYPDSRYLRIFSEEGVPVCVNSDAHNPKRIAQYFDEAYALIISSGFKGMAVFNQKNREIVPISGL